LFPTINDINVKEERSFEVEAGLAPATKCSVLKLYAATYYSDAKRWKVADSIPDEVIGFFQLI
jgi:hypothetical protein